MKDETLEKIVQRQIDKIWDVLMRDEATVEACQMCARFLLGAFMLYAFTGLMGFERLRPVIGATYVISFLLSLFITRVVPWGFPSVAECLQRPAARKFLVALAFVAVLCDCLFWGAAAYGVI